MTAEGTDAWTLPNHSLTPGARFGVDAASVCRYGYARSIRHPYDRAWRGFRTAIFRAYGIPPGRWKNYTIDHLEPLELGGAPFDARNVWPQPKTEAREKDAVEDALHAAVCYPRGYHGVHLTLAQALDAIARDWTHTPVGLPRPRRRAGKELGAIPAIW